jgi:AcrR family transcriptional regulator
MRLPVAERREQLIEAAITVAIRDGIDGTTVRAVAAEAGVAVGVVHYCFRDKDELSSAMAFEITHRKVNPVLLDMPDRGDVAQLIQRAIAALWASVSASRGAELLGYEITAHSLRHPEVRSVSVGQYAKHDEGGREFLLALAASAGIEWILPLELLTRIVTATVDGVVLAWLVDDDGDMACTVLGALGEYLAMCARTRVESGT